MFPGVRRAGLCLRSRSSLVIADAFAAAISFMLAFYTREHVSVFATGEVFAWSESFAPYGALLVFVVAIRLLSFRYCDLYRVRGEFSFFDDSIRIFKATAIGSLLIVAAAFLYRGGFEFRAFSYARSVFVADFIFVLIIVGALRFLMRAVQMFVRSRQINLIPDARRRTRSGSVVIHTRDARTAVAGLSRDRSG